MLALVTLVTAACEPLTPVRVSIRLVPPWFTAYRGSYPAEVLVSEFTGKRDVAYLHLGILCSPENAKQTYMLDLGVISCADEVEAWILRHADKPSVG